MNVTQALNNQNSLLLSFFSPTMVTLKASYMVKPTKETPTGLMYLSEFDQLVAITHAPTVYFYQPSGELTLNSVIHTLKDSLSKALIIFYPLAGRLQWIARGRLQINCNSMGAQFFEAESEAKIDDFGDFCPSSKIRALIPSVDYDRPIHELPLLLVQVTKFSCGGFSLGLGISHILADGECAGHFISEWARIARGKKPENFPFLDRTILQLEDPLLKTSFDISDFNPPPLLIGHSNNTEERNKKTVVVMLKLSKEQINKLKNKANEYRNSETSTNRAFTRYESVTAHLWKCACKARQHESKQLTKIRIPVNFRSRLQPPLPKWYFGCAALPVATTTTSGDIVSKPLSYAAEKLREVIENVTDEYIRSCFVFLKNEPDLSKFRYFHIVGSSQGVFQGNPNISVTDWTRLPLYGADFGWGKEIYMVPGAIGFDGKAFILPGRDEDSSFLIPWRLQETHMDAFKKFFYDDI
ncbi:Spermidine hydroxycinnamoyl transferase [Camellia lanceoleosa]|uniref:Spermidine hydroxycinnamoyl transferase n=1 Tax=Camellia lanceoleosa TaxID=1840588 RepID=A0ACC0I2N0_9ERIC|nr:Spermidine hydroxycinnamoyl transferase [Camellia lanceoleosa]